MSLVSPDAVNATKIRQTIHLPAESSDEYPLRRIPSNNYLLVNEHVVSVFCKRYNVYLRPLIVDREIVQGDALEFKGEFAKCVSNEPETVRIYYFRKPYGDQMEELCTGCFVICGPRTLRGNWRPPYLILALELLMFQMSSFLTDE